MSITPRNLRVLAIDPTSRGFAWAVLESSELIDWRLAHVPEPRHSGALLRIEKLIATFRPQVVAVEDLSRDSSRRSERARNLIRGIEYLASIRHVESVRISRKEVRSALGLEEATKYEMARAIAERYLKELGPKLPRVRKAWMPEDERMNLFDAVGMGLAVVEREKLRPPSPRSPGMPGAPAG